MVENAFANSHGGHGSRSCRCAFRSSGVLSILLGFLYFVQKFKKLFISYLFFLSCVYFGCCCCCLGAFISLFFWKRTNNKTSINNIIMLFFCGVIFSKCTYGLFFALRTAFIRFSDSFYTQIVYL